MSSKSCRAKHYHTGLKDSLHADGVTNEAVAFMIGKNETGKEYLEIHFRQEKNQVVRRDFLQKEDAPVKLQITHNVLRATMTDPKHIRTAKFFNNFSFMVNNDTMFDYVTDKADGDKKRGIVWRVLGF